MYCVYANECNEFILGGGGFLGGIVTYLDSLTCLIFGFDSQL